MEAATWAVVGSGWLISLVGTLGWPGGSLVKANPTLGAILSGGEGNGWKSSKLKRTCGGNRGVGGLASGGG